MSADAIPKLDQTLLYEECPDCEGAGGCCIRCFDEGLVIHACEAS